MKIKNYLPEWLYRSLINFYNKFIRNYYQKSYSQEGEDLILYRIFNETIIKGFYVDIGAHHPKRFSNTYFFYKRGWQGINIEPMPGIKKIFDKYRPEDINLEIAISFREENLMYYMFNDPALNRISMEKPVLNGKLKNYEIINAIPIKTKPLSKILDEFLPPQQNIDFMNIDVEGFDLEVLKSNDWNKYRPRIILVEDREFDIESPFNSEIYKFLMKLNYHLISKTFNTLIFRAM